MKTTEKKRELLSFNKDFQKIEFKNVWFRYPESEKYILKGVSFTIDAKHCYSIVGLNGSGKTTIINLLLKFMFQIRAKLELMELIYVIFHKILKYCPNHRLI